MRIHTASEGISLAETLENDSARFYEDLAKQYTQDAAIFLTFAEENKKNAVYVQRIYYEVITDAIEGGYCFDLNASDYTFEIQLHPESSYKDVLKKAIEIEDKITKFYLDAARQSKSLMADLPRAFATIAKKREKRLNQLRSLLDGQK